MKKTPWFSGKAKPNRVGVYERCWHDSKSFPFPFYFWDGRSWRGFGASDADEAAGDKRYSMFQDNAKWRGLTSENGK